MVEEPDPASVVRSLLSNELESVASEAREGRRDHILNVLDQRGAAEQLIREQYTGRYPFELLQNANDACASRMESESSSTLAVRFILTDEALIIADQGTGFGPHEIKAICGFAQTSKDPRKSIGYKGLGFKSVGEICEKPQIASTDVVFGFEPERVRREVEKRIGPLPDNQRLPLYPYPFLLSHTDFGSDWKLVDQLRNEGFRTVFRLPFKPGVNWHQVAEHLKGMIVPRLLVFLDGIGELEVSGTDADFRAEAVRQPSEGFTEVLLGVDGKDEHWLVRRKRLPVPPELLEPLDDMWRQVEEVGVAAAIPLDDQGRLDPNAESQPLHVYFPTEEKTHLPIILHGDFPLDPDRRFVARSPEADRFRTWLATRLGDLVAEEAAPALADRWPEDGRLVQVFAPRYEADGFGGHCVEEIMNRLETARFIPCMDGQTRLPGEAVRLPPSIPDPVSAHRYLRTEKFGRLVVAGAEKTRPARQLLERLLVQSVAEEDAANLISPPPAAGISEFYEWLAGWNERAGRKLALKLGSASICLTTEGRWVAPAVEGIFFPRERGDPQLTTELPIFIAQVPDVEGARALLEAAGVQPFRWRNLLFDLVFPVLKNPRAEEATSRRAMDILERYFETEGGGDKEVRRRAGAVLLEAVRADGKERESRRADELYFSQEWLGHARLEKIYGDFEKCEFLSESPPDNNAEERRAFLEWLGVSPFPRVLTAETTERNQYLLQSLNRHPHSQLERFGNWRQSEDFKEASECPQGHPQSQQLRTSHALDRFSDLVETKDWHRLALLFRELANHWGSVYRDKLQSVFYCKNTSHSGKRRRHAPSLLGYSLRTEAWVPAKVGNEDVLRSPTDVWRMPPDGPRRIEFTLPVLADFLDTPEAAGMSADLGIIDGARPQPSNLVATLRKLSELHASDAEHSDRLFDLARWIPTKLDEALSRRPTPKSDLEPVPLLAEYGDEYVFSEGPYVAHDLVVAETWRNDVPILDADRELRTLPNFLGLPDLAEELEVEPSPTGLLPRLSEQLETELDRAAPFIAAVAFSQAPTRADSIFARLPRMRVVACRELNMRHQLGELEKTIGRVEAYVQEEIRQEGRTRRAIGTAFLQVDGDGCAPWYALGPPLAEFLDVASQRDAFALLLAGDEQARRSYLRSRNLGTDELSDARDRLGQTENWDDTIAIDPLPKGSTDGDSPATDERDLAQPELEQSPTPGHAPQTEREEDQKPSDEKPLPPLQSDLIEITYAERVSMESPSGNSANRTGGGGRRGPRLIDWEQEMRTRRIHGERGEKVVVLTEKQRLEGLGLDPEAVEWVSKKDELSPFDIRSLHESGHVIYIEVKATGDADRNKPFKISSPELEFAFAKRDRYYIYRVLDVTSPTPSVLVFDDPIGRILAGHAQIKVSSAQLYLPSV